MQLPMLYAAVRNGDGAGRAYLYSLTRNYRPKIMAMTRSESQVEEVIHDCYIDAERAIRRGLRDPQCIPALLVRIIERRVYRERERTEHIVSRLPEGVCCQTPLAQVLYEERRELLFECLQNIPNPGRQIWQMSLYEELTDREIREKLGMSESKLRNHKHRARLSLIALIKRRLKAHACIRQSEIWANLSQV